MKRLNQVLAVEKGVKAKTMTAITALHHASQKAELLNGFEKTYQPLVEEERQQMAPQSQKVQMNAREVLDEARRALTELFDVTATKDWGNLKATADIEVDGKVLLTGVPATYILFLEKQLDNLKTFVEKVQELDPAVPWSKDESTGLFKSPEMPTMRTEKRQRGLILAQATDKFPAQTQVIVEDITVGKWVTTRFSGAIQASEKKRILERVEKLRSAVRQALEEANMAEVEHKRTGETILGYVLG